MTHSEVMAMLDELSEKTGVSYAYDHFAEGESPEPPFICFLYPRSINFGADNKVYFKEKELAIELYTNIKNIVLEDEIEDVFDEHELFYDKSEVWIEDEEMYEVLYTITI